MSSSSTARSAIGLAVLWRRKASASLVQLRGVVAPAEDWLLWHKAQTGCATSARALVDQLMPQALGIALQILRSREDAQDAVQESFLRLWGSQPRDLMSAKLSTYFNAIVINRCKTQLARTSEISTDNETLVARAEATQATEFCNSSAQGNFSAKQLQQAMDTLPARQRMALAMWAYADADAAQIARSMDMEVNAAHQLLHRAKVALRRAFQGDS